MAVLVVEGMVILVLGVLVVALLRSHTMILHRLDGVSRSAPHVQAPSVRPAADRFVPIPTGRKGRSAPAVLRGLSPEGESVVVPITTGASVSLQDTAAGGRLQDTAAGGRLQDTAGPEEFDDVSGFAGVSEVTLDTSPPWALLFFLSSDCMSCEILWKGLGDPLSNGVPEHVRPVVVTRGPASELIAEVRLLAEPARASAVPVVMTDELWDELEIRGASTVVLVDAVAGRVVGESAATGWSHVTDLLAHATPAN